MGLKFPLPLVSNPSPDNFLSGGKKPQSLVKKNENKRKKKNNKEKPERKKIQTRKKKHFFGQCLWN